MEVTSCIVSNPDGTYSPISLPAEKTAYAVLKTLKVGYGPGVPFDHMEHVIVGDKSFVQPGEYKYLQTSPSMNLTVLSRITILLQKNCCMKRQLHHTTSKQSERPGNEVFKEKLIDFYGTDIVEAVEQSALWTRLHVLDVEYLDKRLALTPKLAGSTKFALGDMTFRDLEGTIF
ncbi:unnamed protein product [Sphagnum jensenii]|uniref:Uncharacterized protein n=1 Tax=Sphagnum jensenii TaxID=128206 RepID=A0ABP1B7A6_9BRYO